jgi:hypothetical protein
MIRRSWTQAASIEETLALWAASLREIKKRIRPLFRQERVARNAGLFLIEQTERDCRNDEQIYRGDAVGMIARPLSSMRSRTPARLWIFCSPA